MKRAATLKANKEVRNCVISVPAYFTDSQRQATKKAARMAGLDCRALIAEPTAAALAFNLDFPENESKFFAIIDFGGGTFDFSILEMQNHDITVKAIDGDSQLGGQDIDNVLMDYLIGKIEDKTGVDLSD